MTIHAPLTVVRRVLADALRTARRLARQLQRRARYRRLGWV